MKHKEFVILAGGLGTRLRQSLGELPKTLAPINDKPFLEHLLNFVATQEFRNVIIACGFGADMVRNYFGDGSAFGLRVTYTFEQQLLGTGGAVKLCEPLIDSEDFFVTNGDTFFEVDLNEMLRFHEAKKAVATIALAYREDTRRYGEVNFGKDYRIVSFEEKAENERAGYINGGIYIFRKEVLDLIPPNKVCSLEKEVLPLLINDRLFGFPVDGYFIDIGIPEDYERAKKELPLRRAI